MAVEMARFSTRAVPPRNRPRAPCDTQTSLATRPMCDPAPSRLLSAPTCTGRPSGPQGRRASQAAAAHLPGRGRPRGQGRSARTVSCRRVRIKSAGCVTSVATAPAARPATKLRAAGAGSTAWKPSESSLQHDTDGGRHGASGQTHAVRRAPAHSPPPRAPHHSRLGEVRVRREVDAAEGRIPQNRGQEAGVQRPHSLGSQDV